MAVLKDKLKSVETKQQAVQKKVLAETIKPSVAEAEMVRQIAARVAETYRDDISQSGLTENIIDKIKNTIAKEAAAKELSYEQQKRIEHIATANVVGLGPIEPYMEDNDITEIIVQRYDNICIEKHGIVQRVDAAFNDEEHLQTVINRIVQPVGRQINLSSPIVDARLANGSRVNATIPPVTPDGATLCIRKFSEEAMTGADYIKLGSLDMRILTFLSKCVAGKVSLIVSGGTSTGKTTLLNMLSSFIPENELIVTIEDSCELKLHQSNVRRMEARPVAAEGMMKIDTKMLVRNALRMRPDRIIVGEIRDGTVVDMMSAMSTGHEGSMSTVHANNPLNLVNSRLPILYSMNNSVEFSAESQNVQISEALMMIVHISRLRDGSRKITHVTHINGLTSGGRVKLDDIFVYDAAEGRFKATGYIPKQILRHAKTNGIIIDEDIFKEEE